MDNRIENVSLVVTRTVYCFSSRLVAGSETCYLRARAPGVGRPLMHLRETRRTELGSPNDHAIFGPIPWVIVP